MIPRSMIFSCAKTEREFRVLLVQDGELGYRKPVLARFLGERWGAWDTENQLVEGSKKRAYIAYL